MKFLKELYHFYTIFNIFLLKFGRTGVNIFNVSRAIGLSVVRTGMCYPREIKSPPIYLCLVNPKHSGYRNFLYLS